MPYAKKFLVFLFIVTLAFKLAFNIYFSHYSSAQQAENRFGSIALQNGDSFTYLSGMDNLLKEGEYYFWNGERKVYAGRMPYYGIPYFLLRLIFDNQTAGDIYAIFQIILDSLATIIFALLCFNILPLRTTFWIGYLIHLASFNFSINTLFLWTESLSLSFFIFFLYFYHRFWITKKQSNIILASFFLAFITLLKPYLVIIYPAFLLGVWFCEGKFSFSGIILYFRKAVILSLPLLFFLTPWIIRNAILLKEFIPAQENMRAGYPYTQAHISFANFAASWGGGEVNWDSTDAGCYFHLNPKFGCSFKIPRYALTDGYSIDEIEQARQNFLKLQENYSFELDKSVAAEFERLTEIYRREQPFMYYIGSKFILLKSLFRYKQVIDPKTHTDFNFTLFDFIRQSYRASQFMLYVLTLTLGVAGVLKLTYERKISFVFILIPLIIVAFFVEIRTTEARYVAPVYLILRLGLTGMLTTFFVLIKLRYKKRILKLFASSNCFI